MIIKAARYIVCFIMLYNISTQYHKKLRIDKSSEYMLEDIYESSMKLLESTTVEETYKAIVREARKLVGAQYGSIFLAKHGNLQRVYTSVPFLALISQRKRGYTYKVYKTREPVLLNLDEFDSIHPEFKKRHVKSVFILPLSYGRKSYGVMTLQSTHSFHIAQDQLRYMKLYGAMASLALQKSVNYSSLQRALKARDLFMSMAAHELKTPLTTIQGYLDLMSKKKIENVFMANALNILQQESRRMIYLIEELLTVTHIESGRVTYNFEEISLLELIEHLQSAMGGVHPERSLTIDLHLGARDKGFVIGDKKKLIQVMMNLLTNAAKYSERDTPIDIAMRRDDEVYVIEVKDQGRGISQEELPFIFEGFYKGKDSPSGGMGVGLYLAKEIIRAHHGEIVIDSKIGKGTVVMVRLPRR